jgi:DNA invertase Pin-like site-specific DNA recombinase
MNVAAIYTRVSTHDQQTLPMQLSELRAYADRRGWTIKFEVQEIASGAKTRPQRDEILRAARRREIDFVLVWRLDRWGRSVSDLVSTLEELRGLDVGFISLKESLDLTTPTGRAMAGMLAVFAEFEREIIRERVSAGIANAQSKGVEFGRPATAKAKAEEVKKLKLEGKNNSEISRIVGIGRTSVKRILDE